MNLYFETSCHFFVGSLDDPIKKSYVVMYNTEKIPSDTKTILLHIAADRVWADDEEGQVSFLKNKLDNRHSKVDMEEFTFVKLKAKEYKE